MDRLTEATQLDGWIPARVNWTNGRPTVDWCYLGSRSYKESFEQTVESCLHFPANLLFRHHTSLETLRQLSEVQPGLRPSGFVFHMSRAGAARISRRLAMHPESIVISEARPVDSILRAHLRNQKISDSERIDWVRWLVSALSQRRVGTERHLFIVFDVCHAMDLPLLRTAFPDVPWVFLYRDPLEALISQMEQRGAETIPDVIPPGYFGLDEAANLLEPEEYCAEVLAAICRAALRQQGAGGKLINESQTPEESWSLVSEFFALSGSYDEPEATIADRSDAMTIQKRAAVRERLRPVASQRLYPVYEALESARLECKSKTVSLR
jgi:hypothetical protein